MKFTDTAYFRITYNLAAGMVLAMYIDMIVNNF